MSDTPESAVLRLTRRKGATVMLLVMDGLGGYNSKHRTSELSAARTPNLDRLADEGALGLHDPVSRGITVGSGAGHLGLFGYDPLRYEIGRGTIAAAGVGFELQPGDVATRTTSQETGSKVYHRSGQGFRRSDCGSARWAGDG
jgi:2,3-bisphosphoglycerate-independent phosphoglycerate mutase